MAIEHAMIARAGPVVLASRAQTVLQREAVKGCEAILSPRPVVLEPPYCPLPSFQHAEPTLHPPPPGQDLRRLSIWVAPQQRCDWVRAERLLKQLVHARHRVGLELTGNADGLDLAFLIHRQDLLLLRAAFAGEYEQSRLTFRPRQLVGQLLERDPPVLLRDFHPPPPYSHRLTQPDELKHSIYGPGLSVLAAIPPPAFGVIQVLFQPVDPAHDWHANVAMLLDLEYTAKLQLPWQALQRFPQQTPSGDLRQMAGDHEFKAHDDKPFFAAALRMALIGRDHAPLTDAMAAFVGMIQHGGRPLRWLTEKDYLHIMDQRGVIDALDRGLTFRPGFLVNSLELSTLVHVPPVAVGEHRPMNIGVLEALEPPPELSEGTPLGDCTVAGSRLPVCIPLPARLQHVRVVGTTGYGKSNLMINMALDDIARGHGVALLDPHGTLVGDLLDRLDPAVADRVIYLNPGHATHVPIWNPLRQHGRRDDSRRIDGILRAFKGFLGSSWGDRLERLLRQSIHGVLQLPDGTLFDVDRLLRKDSPDSKQLRRRIAQLVEHPSAKDFWQHDFMAHQKSELGPPHNKLGKLLDKGDTVSWMLSQPESSFDLREVIDRGGILLVDLGDIGTEVRATLGCVLLAMLHHTALSRSDSPHASFLPYHLYLDEGHNFLTDAVEDMIAETRKFGMSMLIAVQHFHQLGAERARAVSSVGSTIAFQVNSSDAAAITREMQGLVEVSDLTSLDYYQAIARVGPHITRFQTRKARQPTSPGLRERIIAQSLARYYRPLADVKRELLSGARSGSARSASDSRSAPPPRRDDDDFEFERFGDPEPA